MSLIKHSLEPANPFSLDQEGQLFIQNSRVIRHLSPQALNIWLDLEKRKATEQLVSLGLIPSKLSSDEGILEHEFLPYVVYPQEFTPSMFREAALCILDLAIALNAYGYHLHDSHPWNVTFRRGRPVFVDFTSIRPGKQLSDFWINQFFLNMYVPIWAHTWRKKRQVAQTLAAVLFVEDGGWLGLDSPRSPLKNYLAGSKLRFLASGFWTRVWRHSLLGQKDPLRLLRSLRTHIASLQFPAQTSEWGDYREPEGCYDQPATFGAKAAAVHRFLSRDLTPGRLVDMACNKGWLAGLASHLGYTVLGVDYDPIAVEVARLTEAPKHNFDVAHMNLIWPTPPQSRGLSFSSAPERWQCKTLLLSGLIHHLCLRQKLSFRALSQLLGAYRAQNLIIEFIPPTDSHVAEWQRAWGLEIPAWYSEAEFLRIMAGPSTIVERLPSTKSDADGPESSRRVMFLLKSDK